MQSALNIIKVVMLLKIIPSYVDHWRFLSFFIMFHAFFNIVELIYLHI